AELVGAPGARRGAGGFVGIHRGETLVDRGHDALDVLAVEGRDDERRAAAAREREERVELDAVLLVEDEELGGDVERARLEELSQLADSVEDARVRGVGDVEEEARIAELVERRGERGDEVLGELAQEADRVGEEGGPTARQAAAADGRVERLEEAVA